MSSHPNIHLFIHLFSKHGLNNYSVQSPVLGTADRCRKHYSCSCEFVVWGQEAMANVHKESSRHESQS